MFERKRPSSPQSAHCLVTDVGVDELNKQHLRLASYAVELSQIVEEISPGEPTQADWQHVDALFGRICLFVAAHFRTEEELMEKHGYPAYAGHKGRHDQFLSELAEVQSKINNRNLEFGGKCCTLLWDFLFVHINEVDIKYKEFLEEKGII
jgi:hemerythrin-like metal-binding protein